VTKRLFDIVLALLALAVLSPVIAGVALLVRLSLGHPVLFQQERAGLGGRPFRMYKFRTMTNDRGEDGSLLPDHERLPRTGRWLRSTSLDELPELWNVVKGDMSLVGPRPLPTSYLERYSARESRRHQVRPGITGWAQVNGRNSLDWNDRLKADVWYVDHRSLALDLKILLRTCRSVVKREGVTAEGEATMYELPHHQERGS